MNYMHLMKKISDEVEVENEDILAIKEKVAKYDLEIDKEEYKKEISKYSSGNSKDLYC